MATLRSINQNDLRNHNLSVVLETMMCRTTPLSRADLAKETGLTKATMSLLVSLLIDNRIVREGMPIVQSVYGRPSTPLLVAGGAMCGIGIQINTDGYGYLVLDLDGSVIAERWVEGDLHGADTKAVFDDLDVMLRAQERTLRKHGYTIAGAGLALPGLVTEEGHLIVARNLGWEDVDLNEQALMRRLDVIAGNESNMAAVAQLPGYATQRADEGVVGANGSFLYISTDIGIGGAVVRGGSLVHGDRGFAGEVGHISVQMDGPLCRCGRRGCVEAYAGRRAIVEAAGIAHGADAASQESIDEFFRRAQAGDARVLEVMDRAMRAIESMIVSIVNVSDLDVVVLGGAWAQLDDARLRAMERHVQDRILARDVVHVRVSRAGGGARPALLGAAVTGLRRFVDEPLAYLKS